MDIDFSDSFPNYPQLSFDFPSDQPIFQQGVLFTDTSSKKESLAVLLELMQWHPTKIIFIDDRLHYLEEIEQLAIELGIPFIGIHYRASELIPYEFDEELAT